MASAVVLSALLAVAYAQVPTVCVDAGYGFGWVGCYSDMEAPKALDGPILTSDEESMTVEVCAAFCASYTFMGVENGNTCYCGNGVASFSRPISTESGLQCNVACDGNPNQLCGGNNALDLYAMSGATTTAANPTMTGYPYNSDSFIVDEVSNSGGDTYGYIGCYSDQPAPNRALTGPSTLYDATTVGLCAEYCTGYTYFGLENGGECYCGNQIEHNSDRVPCQPECYQCCSGDLSQRCGGYYRLSMYQLETSPNYSSYSAVPQADICTYNGPATTVVSAGTTSTYYGPITTATSTSVVVTTDSQGLVTSSTSTVPLCEAGACNSNPHNPGASTVTGMNTATTGPPAQYTEVPQDDCAGCAYYGCVDDNGDNRALRYYQDQLDTSEMTQELCVTTCFAAGFGFAGVSFGTQCYCDEVIEPPHGIINGTQYTNDSNILLECADPAYLCSGDSSEQCGGYAALDVWDCRAILPSTTSSVVMTPASTTAGEITSTFDSTPTPTPTQQSRDGCPGINGTTVEDSYGAVYLVNCCQDSTRGAYGSRTFPDGNYTQCLDECTTGIACNAFSWVPYPSNGGICYLKNEDDTDSLVSADCDTVLCRRVPPPTVTSFSSTASSTTSSTPSSSSDTTSTTSITSEVSTTSTSSTETSTTESSSSSSASGSSTSSTDSSTSTTSSTSSTSSAESSTSSTTSSPTSSLESSTATTSSSASSETSSTSTSSSRSSSSAPATTSSSISSTASSSSSPSSSSLSSSSSSTTETNSSTSSTSSSSTSSSLSSSSSSTGITTSSSSYGSMPVSSLFGSTSSATTNGMCMCTPISSCSQRTTVITYTFLESPSSSSAAPIYSQPVAAPQSAAPPQYVAAAPQYAYAPQV